MNEVPNILCWNEIKQHKPLSGLYVVNQPALPTFPASINHLLTLCAPTTPVRLANYEITTPGPVLPPSFPIQEAPRSMSSPKTKFLQDFLNTMEELEVIGPGHQGDSISPIHLVQKLDN